MDNLQSNWRSLTLRRAFPRFSWKVGMESSGFLLSNTSPSRRNVAQSTRAYVREDAEHTNLRMDIIIRARPSLICPLGL